ncbi:MAG TPA: biotin transporter BioY [Terriglobales bacterium]|jgi:biotin transport system substrate-specific component|nr:biotin transporter BioY [Terriglobales bacterium]
MNRAAEKIAPRTHVEVPSLLLDAGLVVAASALVALAARFSLPLPGTPVPLSLVNFAVLLVGLTLGAKRGFAALVLYLAEGAAGLPVFSPAGPGGILQLLGPTGGFLMSYPFVALLAGWAFRAGKRDFKGALIGATAGELLLFALGVNWLLLLFRVPLSQAVAWGLYPFFAAEVLKVVAAAGLASRWSLRK